MDDHLERLKAALAERYRIERELGRGGMAAVYLATDLKHGRRVAIKVLHAELAAVLGPERFLREIKLTAQLNHPHILPLHDSGTAGGFLFYVMPYVEGESLRDRLKREKQLPLEDALQVAREVADALDYAHRHDIVHRDIKPENILLEEHHAVVADFGIARAVSAAGGERLTETGLAVGTPAYMSPEQAAGSKDLDGRSDLYSLGCVLYEMLSGETPYTGASAQAILAKKLAAPLPRISVVREAVPVSIEAALGKALARTPVDRFRTAAELTAALAYPEAGSGGTEPRPHRGARPVPLALAVVVVAAVAGVLAWGTLSTRHAGAGRIQRIAVLPLENLTGDTAQDYFVDGMHDALVTELAKIGELSVIARGSVLRYRHTTTRVSEIARELHVDAVVEGSVFLAGDSVRVNAQLIAAPTDRLLWAKPYVENRGHVLALYSDVAQAIAREVRVSLTPGERTSLGRARTVDPQANELYLKGRYYCAQWTEEGSTRGLAFYRRAIDQDPAFALAYAGLADCYASLALFTYAAPQDAYLKAKAAAIRALELDSNLGSAHAALGSIAVNFEYDWPRADSAFQRALSLTPGDASRVSSYGTYLLYMGRFPEAIALAKRALDLDPLTPTTSLGLGWTYFNARQYGESIAQIKETLKFDTTFAFAHMELAWNYVKLGKYADALRECATALRTAPPDNQVLLASCAWVHGHAGRRIETLELLQKLQGLAGRQWIDPYNVAFVYESLGEVDQGIAWLRRAIRENSSAIAQMKIDPILDGLRSDPRFASLLREVKLDR